MANKEEKKVTGYVYILTSRQSYGDEMVKIGYADDLEKRLKELNKSSSLAYSLHLYAYYETDRRLTDTIVMDLIDTINPNLRAKEPDEKGHMRTREFFKMTPKRAYKILEKMAAFAGTSSSLHFVGDEFEDDIAEKSNEISKSGQLQRKEPKSRFSFAKCGIKPGSLITFLNDESIVVTVESEYEISYQSKMYTTSKLAEELLNKNSLRGPKFWKYNGEILDDIRTRLESEGLYK